LNSAKRIRASDVVYPVSLVWCMGFAWSSYVAQSTLLEACRGAGFPDKMNVCDENPTPVGLWEAYALATDDVMHFSSSGPLLSCQRMEALDAELLRRGLLKHPAKDETALLNGTCIGVDLCDGSYFAPHSPRLAIFFFAVLETLSRGTISPKGMSALLGVGQWMMLLNRPLFSCLDAVYPFTRLQPDTELRPIGQKVRCELMLLIVLAPYLEADLHRRWAPMITATDASVVFGFGASVATCTEDVARQVGRLAETKGAYIRLSRDGGPTDEPEKNRLGTPHKLDLTKRAFRDVISARKTRDAHPGSLEASGLLLLLKWITRSSKNFSRRIPVLVDAQAVLGAAAKGRTSAGSISLDMKRIAVVTFSSDILPSYVYIPSEDNPADAPSRNVKTTKFGKRGRRPTVGKLPVKNKYAKRTISNQERGLPWWASSDDLVSDFLNIRCSADERERYERLFRLSP